MTRTVARLGVLAGVLTLALASCDETRIRRYASLADAVAAGERERGWIPACLPSTARDLRLAYDLDTNEAWLMFEFGGAADAASFKACLAPASVDGHQIRPPHLVGWPASLSRTLDAGTIKASGYETYRVHDIYMAVDWTRNSGCAWRLGR